jgi:hypothetical protein
LEVLIGTPPPPPPPDVPAFEETEGADDGRFLTVRERMEQHRASPACSSCHQLMDPIGLALENFDATGAWRINDSGSGIDPSGTMYDGTRLNGPVSVRQAVLDRSEAFLGSFTENLLAYALGRVLDHKDMPTVRSIQQAAAADDNRLSSFILATVSNPAFQMTRNQEASQ